MKNRIRKTVNKVIATASMLGLVAGIAPYSAVAQVQAVEAEAVPIPQITMDMTIKWGNVIGTPEHREKVSFDGSVSIRRGSVSLIETIKFDNHGDGKDSITSKQSPVAWDSWILPLWDGVKVRANVYPGSRIVINTDAGGLTVPAKTLLMSTEPTVLQLSDGREIVVEVEKVYTRPFHIVAAWGGPIGQGDDALTPEAELLEAEKYANDLLSASVSESTEAEISASRPVYPPVDFSGAIATGSGGALKLVRTLLFEPGHGDEITHESENYVAWNSKIYGHYDGLLLGAHLDTSDHPIDDTIAVKFGELGFSKEFSLARLYVGGFIKERVVVDGKSYALYLVAIKRPLPEPLLRKGFEGQATPEPKPIPVVKKKIERSFKAFTTRRK